jgi:hypothetical protein
LIAESIVSAAVRALPGDAVAGHAPHVFMHAGLANAEAAAALPAKGKLLPAAVTLLERFTASASLAGCAGFGAQCSSSIAGVSKQSEGGVLLSCRLTMNMVRQANRKSPLSQSGEKVKSA